ncbi:hypothetical protein A3I95_02700 [Candidatus Nomurabacteria bacterium RIFCSPLOWO2_02_FULL_44_12]|nr:MAG: hypothetical protein A3I95_02700 [Candidatus Nomurabacteria bacterium RIFCSPLOWO2_02_FULL_44_12]
MIQKFIFYFCLIIFFILGTVNTVSARDLTSASFIVRDPVIGAGGGYATSGSFRMFQSLDPVLIGVNASTSFLGHFGFLYFQDDVAPAPVPTPAGGGGGGDSVSVTRCGRIADFNCDGRVNLLDFSILLYYTDKSGTVIVPYDLSANGRIDLMDISIMFYHWDEE